MHPKYQVPAACFAYVGNAAKPSTWKLPYRLADGSIDLRRLPKAVQAILSNYRGVKVSGIPEADIPRCSCASPVPPPRSARCPAKPATALVYHQLAEALDQEGRLGEVPVG